MRMTNRSIFTIAAGVALLLAAMVGSITSTDAHAEPVVRSAAYASEPTFQTTKPTHRVATLTIVAMHRLSMGRLAVAFNDGSSYDVRACKREDGRRCWWDADARGNRRGDTILRLRGWSWSA
jgi:hypothetical protein